MQKSKTWTTKPAAKILLWNREIVNLKTRVVEEFGVSLDSLIDYMTSTMYAHNGVGLSAPQIGCFVRLAVVQLIEDRTRPPLVLVNPAIINTIGEATEWEGCLSIPGDRTRARILRPKWLKVIFQDAQGQSQEMECEGMMARVIQHECDHLEGIFYVNHLSSLKRDIIVKNYRKSVDGKDPKDLERSFMFSCPWENSTAVPVVPRQLSMKEKAYRPLTGSQALGLSEMPDEGDGQVTVFKGRSAGPSCV